MSTIEKSTWGNVVGWIAVILAVIAFFWWKVPLSIIAMGEC